MPSRCDAAEPDQCAEYQSGGDCRPPASSERQQKREGCEREAERRMPRDEGAVALALCCGQRGGRELAGAAELGDLIGPCPPPMILQHRIRNQAGP